MSAGPRTAAAEGLGLCLACHALTPCPPGRRVACRRCGAALALRKPHSLRRTGYYVVLGFLFLIPANLYPIMTILQFGRGEPSTIVGGVAKLWSQGLWGIATIVFVASVVVPLAKLFGLCLLLYSVHYQTELCPLNRTRLFRLVDFLGRWSMLDIFVVTLLVGLVHLGQVALVLPGLGALAFVATVIITLFAAQSFDPRLIWDAHSADEACDDNDSDEKPPHA
ncbi:MAG: paraquat-inducible protein A [Gammaproteobacteria bacterium]|nr:paraquat-inducible protein A [Gammaproteobacteria bacterium]